MNWQNTGYLISKNKYNENSIIAEFFTENYGKTSGIVFGASSKKIRNYLLIGNKFHLNYFSKNLNKLGYFNLEIDKLYTPTFLENKKKLFCIVYCMNLIKILTVENQENKNIYLLINYFFKILNRKNWIKDFILWELEFFKIIGYDINFDDYVCKTTIKGNVKFVVKSVDNQRIVPSFLINKNKKPESEYDVFEGLKIVGDFLDKTILKPNNINYPTSRLEFINILK